MHVTHTGLRAQLVGGGCVHVCVCVCVCVCVDISTCVHLCLRQYGQSLEECRLSDLNRENADKLSFLLGQSRKRKAGCSSFGESRLNIQPPAKKSKRYRGVRRQTGAETKVERG